MALVINSNVASLATQRALTETQKDSAVSLERLSSGLRINSAKDDAAGLAISNRFTAQINGLSAAMRNASDGISMLQTGDAALSEITDNLQRMRELAVQAANGTNQATDRDALDAELQQLVAEIERVADATEFNGNTLFDGTFTANIQVGADNATANTAAGVNRVTVGATSFINAQTASLGTTGTTTISTATSIGDAVTGLSANDLTINGVDVGAVGNGSNGSYAANLAAAIQSADSDVTATVGTSSLTLGNFTDFSDADGAGDATYTLTINGISIFSAEEANGLADTDMDNAIDSKQSELAAAGITYTGSAVGNDLVLTRADGGNIVFAESYTDSTNTNLAGGFANSDLSAGSASDSATIRGYGEVTLSSDFEIVIGGSAPANAGLSATTVTAGTATGTALSAIDLQDETNSQTALTSIDAALNTVNQARANLGANYSRLDSVSSNLATTVENYTSARSRVQDADFAVESANLARTQVLQQAGISVLAQANALPQQVLALLQ
jgi:flagellin